MEKIDKVVIPEKECVYFISIMKILSLLYAHWMTEDEIQEHQCSDRIWIPSHMFRRWLTEEDEGTVVIATLDTVGVCVYGPHSAASTAIYAPDWVCRALKVSGEPEEDEDADDYIMPIRARPPQCTFIQVQPFTSAHIRAAQETLQPAEDILSRGFERYTCWSVGQSMQLLLESGDILEVDIIGAKPENQNLYCIRGGEIEMELLAPLDAIEEEQLPNEVPEIAAPEIAAPEPVVPEPVVPEIPAPKEESHEEKRKKMAAAALARLGR